MRRFTFKLQKLLDIRVHKEKLIQNELAKAQFERNTVLLQKDQLSLELDNGRTNMARDVREKVISAETLQLYQRYFRRLREQIRNKDALIKLADERIRLINERLVEARKQRRILERLKENQWKKYQAELLKEEQDFFDEVGTTNFIRGMQDTEFKEKSQIPMKENKQKKHEEKLWNNEVHA